MKIEYDAARELNRLPEPLKQLERGPNYPVQVSPAVHQLAHEVDARQARHQTGSAGP